MYTEYEGFVKRTEEVLAEFLEDFYEVEIKPVRYLKNNGVVKENLQIFLPGQQVGHVLDPEPLFSRYLAGEAMEKLVCEVVESYIKDEPQEIMDIWKVVRDYEKVKNRLFIRVINSHANQMLLSMCPYVSKLDLALTFRIEVCCGDEGLLSMTVDHTIFNQWQIPLDRLYRDALANTQKRFPGVIIPVHRLLDADDTTDMLKYDTAEASTYTATQAQNRDDVMFAITNTKMFNGAAAVFYPGLMRKLSKEVGCDLYLLPSSIHEMMAVPAKYWDDPTLLKAVVADANETVVMKEDRLGDHVYRYSGRDDTFVIAA